MTFTQIRDAPEELAEYLVELIRDSLVSGSIQFRIEKPDRQLPGPARHHLLSGSCQKWQGESKMTPT